jgi:hypothetical protein
MRSAVFPLMSIAVGLVLLTGCGARRWEAFQQRMDAMIGTLTISQALQQWGPPTYERHDPTTGITILAWEHRQMSSYSYPPPVAAPSGRGGGFVGGIVEGLTRGAPSYTMHDEQREVLMLGFRPDGYLAWWQYQQR